MQPSPKIEATWLDRAISWVSPRAGLDRIRARSLQRILLAYEGARSERRQGGWVTTGASGNAEIAQSAAKLRENARDLVRNNSFATKAVKAWAKCLVGYGITPQADTGSQELNARIDGFFAAWTRECCSDRRLNYYAVQNLIARSAFTDGEVLVRIHYRRPQDGLAVPFQIQVLEADHLDSGKTESLAAGWIINGVQYDAIGRVTGYWIFPNHPGEVISTTKTGFQSKFVAADSILHYMVVGRPGDARGVSRFAPVIAKLRDIDEYADAEITRKKIEACLAAIITQPQDPDEKTVGPTAVDSEGKKIETFRPGMVMYGAPGVAAQFFAPAAGGDYSQHKTIELREVATGLQMPYSLMAEDPGDTNYSSSRIGRIDFRDGIHEERWNWFIPQICDPIWRVFIDVLTMNGQLEAPVYGVQHNPPPFDLLDREAEGKADQIELQTGKMSWPQFVGEQGRDPVKHLAEITEWKPMLDKAGVTFGAKGATNDRNDANS